jgi:PAS domain S-box-containing protein
MALDTSLPASSCATSAAQLADAQAQLAQLAERLARQQRYQAALARCSRVLLDAVGDDVQADQLLTKALHELLQGSGVSRISLWRNVADGQLGLGRVRIVHLCMPDVELPLPSSNTDRRLWSDVPTAQYQALAVGAAWGGPVAQVYADHALLTVNQASGVRSFLDVPVQIDGQWWGVIAFADHTVERVWNEQEIQLLQTAADMVGTFVQRCAVERALRERSHFVEHVAAATPDSIYVYDLVTRRTVYETRSIALQLGYSPAEAEALRPNVFARLLHPDDRAVLDAQWENRRHAATEVSTFSYRLRHRDGADRWFTSRELVFARDADGTPTQILGITHDITARKQAEQALQTANRELRERVTQLSALHQIAQALTQWSDLPTALEAMGTVVAWLFDRAAVAVWQLNIAHDELVRRIVVRDQEVWHTQQVVALGDDAEAARLLQASQPQLFPARLAPPRLLRQPYLPEAAIGGCLVVALQSQASAVGLLCIRATSATREYSAADGALAQIVAGALANALESARMADATRAAAAEEERKRLARELHDSVSQALFQANLTADVLPQLWAKSPARGQQALAELQQMTRSALAEMRTLLIELRPATITNAPLHELLPYLTAAVGAKTGIDSTVELQPVPVLPPDVQVALYRIAQEALHNVVKHAQASQIGLSLCATPDANQHVVALSICDDGRGFDATQIAPTRMGLSSMRERALSIGATIELTSTPGGGTTVTVCWQGSAVPPKQRSMA